MNIKTTFLFGIIFIVLIFLNSHAKEEKMIWKDHTQPVFKRVDDLVSRLNVAEKVSQLIYNSEAIPRLDIPEYNWWSECLHGVARNGRATVFPQAIGMAATFDEELIFRIATAISDEARAKFNIAQKIGNRGRYAGLTFWTPNINIFRDPRWGRGQETYGEDPFLTGRIGTAFVKGLQGDHPVYLKAAACAKHYAVHSGPEGVRHEFNAVPSKKDFFETYLPAFEKLVRDANVEAVMCAYNRTYDEPCCGSPYLLKDILREKWGFKGHIVSDCWAIVDFHAHHKVTANPVESAALALKSGVNVNCGNTFPYLIDAVEQGLIAESDLDEALKPLLTTRFKLGLFDPPGSNPFDAISPDVVNLEKHRFLAREAAAKSCVLLKNDDVLPLKKDTRKIYVVGHHAASTEVLLGNYNGVSDQMVTILEGIVGKVSLGTTVEYKHATLLDRENINPIDWTTGEAHNYDVIVAVMGISGLLEGEEGESIASPDRGDRFDIRLPQNQVNYLRKLRSKGDKPIILILTGGSPAAIPEVPELVDAILWVWYPGEQGGNAVADVLFGDVNPAGRLPITFPKSVDQLPAYDDYSMEGRTYRYMTDDPLYPFGFGLSYSKFAYQDIKLSAFEIKKNDSVDVSVTVVNNGPFDGDEVVQCYLTDIEASTRTPRFALKGFERIHLKKGETAVVQFTVTPEMMMLVNDDGEKVLEKGQFKITIGGASPGARSAELGAADFVEAVFNLE